MIRNSSLTASVMIVVGLMTGASAKADTVLWYGGDAGSIGSINNSSMPGSLGDQVFDDFVVPVGGWHVTELFSNNIASYPIATAPFTQASWSIETNLYPGHAGNVLFSGVSAVTVTPTGRAPGGETEYQVAVTGLSFDLPAGTYYMDVSPVVSGLGIYYVAVSGGANAVGVNGPSQILQVQTDIENGVTVSQINGQVYPAASLGVVGEAIPEPADVWLVGICGSALLIFRQRNAQV